MDRRDSNFDRIRDNADMERTSRRGPLDERFYDRGSYYDRGGYRRGRDTDFDYDERYRPRRTETTYEERYAPEPRDRYDEERDYRNTGYRDEGDYADSPPRGGNWRQRGYDRTVEGAYGQRRGPAPGDYEEERGYRQERDDDQGRRSTYYYGRGTYPAEYARGYPSSQAYDDDRPYGGFPNRYGEGGDGNTGRDWQGPHTGVGPKDYQRSPERIHEEVCERLMMHGRLDASQIEVRVEDDEVTLEGTVPDRDAKRLADDLAFSVGGVRDIHNHLRLPRREADRAASEEQEPKGEAKRNGKSTSKSKSA